MSDFFWNDYDASNNAFTRMEVHLKENKPEGDNNLSRQSSASNTDAQHGDGKMALQASPGRAQPGRRALSRSPSANSLFIPSHLQGLQREPSFENIGVAPADTWSLGIPVETPLPELSSSEDEEDEDDDEPVAPPPPPPRARGGRKRGSAPRKRAGGRKARVQEDAEDSEDDAGATAKPPVKAARSSSRTRGSATTRGRASTRGRATSTRARAPTARAQTRTRTGPARSAAVQTPIEDTATSDSESLEELERRLGAETIEILRRRQEEEAVRRANAEDHASTGSEDDTDSYTSDSDSVASAVSDVVSVAPAVQATRTITDDVANFTPSPSRSPLATTSASAPAPVPSATLESAATAPQKTSIECKERAIEAQLEVEERANTLASPRRTNLHDHSDLSTRVEPLSAAVAGAPALPNHGLREESAQQIASAPTPSMLTTRAVHHASPAAAQNPLHAPAQSLPPAHAHPAPRAPVQNQPAASVPWSNQAAPSTHAHTQYTNTPMDGMPAGPPAPVHRQPRTHSHYRLPAHPYHPQPAPVHYRQHTAPAQSSYAAAPPTYPHATIVAARPMGSTMLPAPQPTMPAPPVQSQAIEQASAASHGSARSNKRPWSSTQEPWTASYASAAAPASAHAQSIIGAFAGSSAHASMPASSGIASTGAQNSARMAAHGAAPQFAPLPYNAAMTSATSRSAYHASPYGASIGKRPRILYAGDQVPTVVAVLHMLREVIDGDAVFSDELYQMIWEHHPNHREHLQRVVALARKPDTLAPMAPPTKCTGMKATNEAIAPGNHRCECLWTHQGHPGQRCGWAFEIDESQLDDSAYKDEIYRRINEHVGQKHMGCWWQGCNSGGVFLNVGGHTAQHIFDYVRDAKRARLA
ncbi:hypothetical protein K523DRAFT_416201 [Schizophyllum commune Tattone D]|nr:hypothetical protein K523DRAFT_416201 [Schizophyllum commune Tattone D]